MEEWTHVTQPLCTDGSALNNVIRELSREADHRGISTAVVASDARDTNFPHARLLPVDFLAYLSREYLTTAEMRQDAIVGHLGRDRPNVRRLYRPVAEALDATDGPIIVHDGFLGAAGLVAIKERHPRRPLFLYVHNSLSRGYSRREVRSFLSLADGVVCVSAAMRGSILTKTRNDRVLDKVHVVLNGVDSERFHPDVSHGGEMPSVLFVGMMTEFKGPHVLLAALRQLRVEGISFRATFLGSSTHAENLGLSPYEVGLRRDQREVGDCVTFRPFVPNTEVPSIYQAHEILVVPSQFDEPCALVVLEGMASGLAMVATRRGGIPELGAQSIDYFDSVDDLVTALRPLLLDPERRARQGQMARRRALQLSWASRFDEVRRIVEEVSDRSTAG
ncbi:MAG: glycosyltransferase family 4 protein [Acidimicrobiales bacterium]